MGLLGLDLSNLSRLIRLQCLLLLLCGLELGYLLLLLHLRIGYHRIRLLLLVVVRLLLLDLLMLHALDSMYTHAPEARKQLYLSDLGAC